MGILGMRKPPLIPALRKSRTHPATLSAVGGSLGWAIGALGVGITVLVSFISRDCNG